MKSTLNTAAVFFILATQFSAPANASFIGDTVTIDGGIFNFFVAGQQKDTVDVVVGDGVEATGQFLTASGQTDFMAFDIGASSIKLTLTGPRNLLIDAGTIKFTGLDWIGPGKPDIVAVKFVNDPVEQLGVDDLFFSAHEVKLVADLDKTPTPSPRHPWQWDANDVVELQITVPEPHSLVLLSLGVAALLFASRRKQ